MSAAAVDQWDNRHTSAGHRRSLTAVTLRSGIMRPAKVLTLPLFPLLFQENRSYSGFKRNILKRLVCDFLYFGTPPAIRRPQQVTYKLTGFLFHIPVETAGFDVLQHFTFCVSLAFQPCRNTFPSLFDPGQQSNAPHARFQPFTGEMMWQVTGQCLANEHRLTPGRRACATGFANAYVIVARASIHDPY